MSRTRFRAIPALLTLLLLGLPISVNGESPPPENVLVSGGVSVQLPGDSWMPIDGGTLAEHRASPYFAGATRHEQDAVVAVLFIQPWETVPAKPTTVETMDEYLAEVEAEISATRDDVAVIARNTATSSDGAVLGMLHVLRNSGSLSADLGWSDQYAVHQLGWSAAAKPGLVQLYVYIRDDDASGSLVGKLSAPNAYSFYLPTADPPADQPDEKRSWFTVVALFIGLLAIALLGLRVYQRHRARSREEEFDLEADSARPTPVVPWEDELDEIFEESRGHSAEAAPPERNQDGNQASDQDDDQAGDQGDGDNNDTSDGAPASPR